MDELAGFISDLNAACENLQKKDLMPPLVKEPWRYYSPPLDDEHEFQPLRSVLEAGRFTVEAEFLFKIGDDSTALEKLERARQLLNKSQSKEGKAESKKRGNAAGGRSKVEGAHYEIFRIADDLLAEGADERGLAGKVSRRLMSETAYEKDENKVKVILNKQKHLRVDR